MKKNEELKQQQPQPSTIRTIHTEFHMKNNGIIEEKKKKESNQ